VFFSDAVFAIAITLLVLEIKLPHLGQISESELRWQLVQLLPKFIGFIISFFIIGKMWVEHHRIFTYLRNYDMGLLWRNLIFLLSVAFVPFPTAFFSEYHKSRTALVLYAATFAAMALAKLWVWQYAVNRPELLEEGVAEIDLRRISRRSLAPPLGSGAAIVLSLLSVYAAPLGFTLIPLFARWLDPSKSKQKKKEVLEIPAGGGTAP